MRAGEQHISGRQEWASTRIRNATVITTNIKKLRSSTGLLCIELTRCYFIFLIPLTLPNTILTTNLGRRYDEKTGSVTCPVSPASRPPAGRAALPRKPLLLTRHHPASHQQVQKVLLQQHTPSDSLS